MSSNGVWQKTLVYLGLWEEPEAEPYDELGAREAAPAPEAERSSNVRPSASCATTETARRCCSTSRVSTPRPPGASSTSSAG